MFNKAQARSEDTEKDRSDTEGVPWPLGSRTPTSWSSASAPPAAWRCCRSRRPASTWSASKPARGSPSATSRPTKSATTSATGRWRCRRRNRKCRRIALNAKANTTRAGSHPMMNAVGGTTLHYWAQSWRLNPWDFKVVSETTKRYGASRDPEGLDGRRLAVRPRRARAVLRQGRIRNRRLGTGRQHQGRDRSARQHLRGAAHARLSDAAAAQHRLHRPDGGGGARPRLASVPGAGVDQLAPVSEPRRVHVSRLLQQGRLPRRREERPAPHDHPARAGNRPAEGRHARARDVDRHRRERPRHRRDLRDRRPGVHSAGEGRAARELHLRELRLLLLSKSKAFPNGLSNNHGPGRPPLPQPRARRRR